MRFRLSTLLVVAPLFGLAMFGGLKWYETLAREKAVSAERESVGGPGPVEPFEIHISCEFGFPESDFGPIPVARPISLR